MRELLPLGIRFGCRLVGMTLIGLCAMSMTAGCAKKVALSSMVFDLDKVFDWKSEAPKKEIEESAKDKGLRRARERDYQGAVEAFKQYVEEQPEDFFGFNAMGVCYKNEGDDAMAMKNFERALEFADEGEDRAKVLANIGNLYYARNKPQAALGYYKEAAAVFEPNPLYLVHIARTFILLNETDRAERVLATAEENIKALDKYEKNEEKGLGYYLMANCHLALGSEDKVFKYLELAFKANPDRYVKRVEKDVGDSKSLFYTLKDEKILKGLLKQYASRMSPAQWIVRD